MKSQYLITALLLLLSLPTSAQADISGKNHMYDGCKAMVDQTNEKIFIQGLCSEMVSSVLYYSDRLPDRARFCIPEGSNVGQATAVVVNYMASNPDTTHKTFIDVATTALRDAWPCGK